MTAQATTARKPHHGSLLVIFLTVFVDLLGFGMVLPLLPIYAEQFAVDESGWQLGLLMASFSAMQFLFAPMWGRLSDRYGRRPILMIGLAGSVIFYTLFGVASIMQSLALLFVSRIGAGIMGATISTAQAYIADTTTLEQRPRGMALIGMAFGVGFTFGPLLGFLAVPSGHGDPGPWPGYAAAALSLMALLSAIFLLPESLHAGSEHAAHKLLDLRALRRALSIPSIGAILLALFVCVLSFANFETTISLLIWGSQERSLGSPFNFDWRQVCLTFALIGLTLSVVQGGIVRKLAGRVSEGVLAASGCLMEMVGFLIVSAAIHRSSVPLLLTALVVIVSGFSFMMPTLMSLLSRRSDPARQGAILGVGQSVNSMARIVGSAVGIPLLMLFLSLPYYAAAGLMGVGLVLVIVASLAGRDFAT